MYVYFCFLFFSLLYLKDFIIEGRFSPAISNFNTKLQHQNQELIFYKSRNMSVNVFLSKMYENYISIKVGFKKFFSRSCKIAILRLSLMKLSYVMHNVLCWKICKNINYNVNMSIENAVTLYSEKLSYRNYIISRVNVRKLQLVFHRILDMIMQHKTVSSWRRGSDVFFIFVERCTRCSRNEYFHVTAKLSFVHNQGVHQETCHGKSN